MTEEHRIKAETGPTPATDPEGSTRLGRMLRRAVGISAALALMVIPGVILYQGEMTKPWWEGAGDKRFWDYLELLIVPAVLAIGVLA